MRAVPTIGLAVIARDEETTLPRLLESIEGAFDQVVLVDTGSADGTVDVFREWCERTGQRRTIGHFQWVDDFAAARNHADSLLDTDWTCWADCDDEIIGAENLRTACAIASAEIAGLTAEYDYDEYKILTTRERLVRRGKGRWTGRLHEQQQILGEIRTISRELAYWQHNRTDWTDAGERNDRIEERWKREDPFDYCRWDTERDLYLQLRAQQIQCQQVAERCDWLEACLQGAADRLTELTQDPRPVP